MSKPYTGSRLLFGLIATLAGLGIMVATISGEVWAQQRLNNNKKDAAKANRNKEKNDEKAKEEESPKVKVERGAGGKKVYVIKTGFVIEGRIQKPNAFYVLQRSQINYDWAALKQDFLPRISSALTKSPF